MLFWRMHRCARIVFSLRYQLGEWTPEECIDHLMQEVGHERANATAEVRRSVQAATDPCTSAPTWWAACSSGPCTASSSAAAAGRTRELHDAVLRQGRSRWSWCGPWSRGSRCRATRAPPGASTRASEAPAAGPQGPAGAPSATCSFRMRRSSLIVSGAPWQVWPLRTTSSDSACSRCALAYSTTPSLPRVTSSNPGETETIECRWTALGHGQEGQAGHEAESGSMFSTLVVMRRSR